MLRKESDAVPEGNDPVPQQDELGSGQTTLVGAIRMLYERMDSHFNRQKKKMDKRIMKMTRGTSQRISSLEQDVRQPRLAMEAGGHEDTKTHEHTEGATAAVQAMHGDSCSANRVDPDPTYSTSSDDDCLGLPASSCSGENALVANGAAAPKSCFPSLETCSSVAAGDLLPTRRNLYSNRDHLQQATSSALLDRGNEFNEF